jgi:hypothetical protein
MKSTRATGILALLAVALAAYSQASRPLHPIAPAPGPQALAGISPFSPDCNGSQNGGGANYRNAPVEPYAAVDPSAPLHLVGVWQQDRWSDGGASGILSAVSRDGGRTWSTSAAQFSICTGGVYERASDPWVTISPDGTAYQIALGLNGVSKGDAAESAVLVSRSADGGLTWGEPATIVRRPSPIDDKVTITADPNDSHYVYAVWDRSTGSGTAAWFSSSSDNGGTWAPARTIYVPSGGGYAGGHQIVVLPDGSVTDIFILNKSIAGLRSRDHGATWAAPVAVSTFDSIGVVDPNTQRGVRTGGFSSVAVDGASGAIYVVWADARFSAQQRDGIAFSRSLDYGKTWSQPVQVNQATNVQAFTPTIAVSNTGGVAVTYTDFRDDTGISGTLLARYWRIVSQDGGATWQETPVSGPFDLLTATIGSEPFLGDYQGARRVGGPVSRLLCGRQLSESQQPDQHLR